MNVFIKPNEQSEARFDYAMARKGGIKSNLFPSLTSLHKTRSLFLLIFLLIPFTQGYAAEAYAVYSQYNYTLTFYYDSEKASRIGSIYPMPASTGDPGWTKNTHIEIVVFDASFSEYRPTSTHSWFKGQTYMTTITDIGILNTSEVTDMSYMFCGCMFLTSLDVTHFNTANVTDMSYMFADCSSLTSIDVASFNTANVTNMSYMFNDCSDLTNLDMTHFNTANVTNMSYMFKDCSDLTNLDLTCFNTAKVTNMYRMFCDCSKLRTIFVSDLWSTASVTSSTEMFYCCYELVGGQGTNFNASYYYYYDASRAHIDGGSANPGYLTAPNTIAPYAVKSGTTLTFYYDKFIATRDGTIYGMPDAREIPGWRYSNSSTMVFDQSFANYRLTSTSFWFSEMSSLTTITGIDNLNTSQVTNMSYMFDGCSSLTTITGIDNLNTSQVTNMSYMFDGCSSLTSLNLTSFDTHNVTNMSYMFKDCSDLTNLDLTCFNTAKVTDMYRMFYNCSELKTIFVSDLWSTASVTSSSEMFYSCDKLVGGQGTHFNYGYYHYYDASRAHIDGGSADPGYLTDPNANVPYAVLSDGTLTFYYDNLLPTRTGTIYSMPAPTSQPSWASSSVTNVVIDSSFTDYSPTSTYRWFRGCSSLQNTDFLNDLNITTIGEYAFYGCTSLTSVSIPQNITAIGVCAFDNCSSLTTVIARMTTPASIEASTFPNCRNQILYVPAGCLSAYAAADYWKNFKEIVENSRITFADANVEAICVQNWDTDGNGYLDQVEAYMVTDLGTAFKGKTQITSFNELQYFTGLTTISSQAFSGCTGLTTIAIPSNVKTIGDHAFSGCSSLAIITNLNNVTTIGASAFYYCTSLTSVSVDVAVVESNTFSGCSNLSEVTFGSKVANIKEGAFKNCTKLTTISIPGAVVSINSNCFEGCTALNTVTLHQGTKYLLPSAFKGCYNLQTITLPDGLLSIGESAFHTCQALKNIDIPSTVTNIEGNVFLQCTSLSTVTVNWPTPLTVPATAFPRRTHEGLIIPQGTLAAYQAADVWKEFKYLREMGAVSTIEFADANVEALCVQNWDLDGDGKLQTDEAALVTTLGSVFSSNVNITSFNELQYFTGLTAIDNSAFTYCTALTSIVIPENVKTIGTSAFDGCTQLPKINIPASVTSIGQYAFRNTPRLKTVTVNWATPITVSADAFPNRANQGLYVPAGKKATYQAADVWKDFLWIREAGETPPFIVFEDPKVEEICLANWDTDGDGYLQMDEAAAVTSLGNKFKNSEIVTFDELIYFTGLIVTGAQSFRGCASLRSVVLPSGLSTISGQTFYGCTSLASVEIPTSVTAIQGSAFSGCTALKDIDIPSSVTTIGGTAFNGCTSLEEVTVHWTTPITDVDETAFPDRASQWLNVPSGTKAAYHAADVWKDFLMDYGLAVKGVDVSIKNQTDVLGDGKVSYDPDTHVLTLNNADISTNAAPGIQVTTYFVHDDLTVNLVGSNTMAVNGYVAMPLRCNTTITGTGTLTLSGTGGYIGMRAAKQLTIEGGCIINASDINSSVDGASLLIRDVDTQVNLTTDIYGFDSVTLEDGLTFTKPLGGYYDTTNKYVATIFGSQWNSGVTISSRGDYGLSVKGISVNPANQDDVLGDGTVSFDVAALTLTLNNANIVTESGHAIETTADYSGEQLIIKLLGQNYIDSGDDYEADIVLSTNTFIKGPGELTLEDNSSSAIWINGGHHLFITNGCTIRARFIDAIGSDPSNLFVANADTRIILRAGDETEANIYGFNDVILDEDSGLQFTYPAGAWYDGYELCVMDSEGEAYGVTIECPPYVVYDSSTTTLTFYHDRQRSTHNGTTETTYDLNAGENAPGWRSDDSYANVTTVVFDESFAQARPTTTASWFAGMTQLTAITGIEYLNTSEVTSMRSMFFNCSSLTSIDVSHFDTQNVTSMRTVFYNCSGLTSIDVSHFDTRNVTIMRSMFSGCSSLTSLNVSNFDTRNVTDMSSMFLACSSLTSLDVSSFNTSNVTDMSYLFQDCSNLTTFDLRNFNTQNVTNLSFMFYRCTGLTNVNLSSFNTQSVTTLSYMFGACPSLTTLDLSSFNTATVTYMSYMFVNCSNLKTIYVGDGWSTEGLTGANSSTNMFAACTSIVGGKGTVYDSSHWDKEYARIDGGPESETPGYLTEKGYPYAVLSSDGKTLTFYCDNLRSSHTETTYDLNEGNNIPAWVADARAVNKVVFDESFQVARPTSMYLWFSGMTDLTTFVNLDILNTKAVTNMSQLFIQCTSLTRLDLTSFDTQNVTDMNGMFWYCTSLQSLDLSSFDTENVTDMSYMFQDCSNLKTIYANSLWNRSCSTENMFQRCESIVGGRGTTYDANHIDGEYAHIDGGTSNPGYFTAKPAFLLGDVNGDGQITIADVTALVNIILGKDTTGQYNHAAADVDQDNQITIADVTALVNIILGKN